LAACTAAAALLQLDGTLIAVALPSVGRGLHVSGAATSALLSAYFAAYALALIPGGVLVDRVGSRRVALGGLAVFGLAAAVGALAGDFGVLLAARVVQGAGAGFVSPAALAGAVSLFPPERRGSALGLWGASAGAANVLGPLLGGLLTVAFGWRADWWVLVPATLAVSVLLIRMLPSGVRGDRARGSGILSNPVVRSAAAITALTFAVMIGSFYLAEQYLQRVAGYSALAAGAVLVVIAVLVALAAPCAGRMVDRRGEAVTALIGFMLAGVGLAVLGIPGVPLHDVATLGPLVPLGLGLGLLFAPPSRAALNATGASAHGRTSALLSIGRMLGAGIGTGLAGVALAHGVSTHAVHHELLAAAAVCLILGLPASLRLPSGNLGIRATSSEGELTPS
jgi:predicted MFS family arabinose efflux permease